MAIHYENVDFKAIWLKHTVYCNEHIKYLLVTLKERKCKRTISVVESDIFLHASYKVFIKECIC